MRKGELKTTTNIKMGKKETKEVFYIYIYIYIFFFFFPFMESLWKKRIFFGILQSLTLLLKKALHFIVFPLLEKEVLHLRSRRWQRLG